MRIYFTAKLEGFLVIRLMLIFIINHAAILVRRDSR